MFKTKSTLYNILLVVNLLGIALALFFILKGLFTSRNNMQSIYNLNACLIALLFALYYIFYGYSKNASKYYKNFGIVIVVCQALSFSVPMIDSKYNQLLSIIKLFIIMTLVMGENLGKEKSLLLCVVLIMLSILELYINKVGVISQYGTFARFSIYCVYSLSTYAKYLDKQARGAK